jgi:hypothetical protein
VGRRVAGGEGGGHHQSGMEYGMTVELVGSLDGKHYDGLGEADFGGIDFKR